jgi:hypothetical protein
MNNSFSTKPTPEVLEETTTLNLRVDNNLYRAFQRCCWILINETNRNQLEVMDEMVRDFLIKHGC